MARTTVFDSRLRQTGREETDPAGTLIPDTEANVQLDFNISQHLDPTSTMWWGIEISRDGGANWQFWVGASCHGGPRTDRFGNLVTHSTCTKALPRGANIRTRAWLEVSGLRTRCSGELVTTTGERPEPTEQPSHMSVTVDAVADSSGADGTAVDTLSWSHTVGAGTEQLLVVGISLSVAPQTGSSGVDYPSGTAMTAIGSLSSSNGFQIVEQWRLIAPATGANTIVATFGANADDVSAGSVSFNGVDQTTPVDGFVSAAGSGVSEPNVTLTTDTTGDIMIDTLVLDSGTAPTPDDQTQRWNFRSGGASGPRGCGSTQAGGGDGVMSWSAANVEWTICACNVRQSVAPPAVTPRALTQLGVGR